ncbi:hypothetical protein BP6252_10242 [Coleophoma cylindrospora]|uniref:Uncharacterized protein n=1 Tax=Coleophoma cylindrospora TaxID=1849047 RepID=A0A3D8QSC1_9HELO|nr:hypothetical protein BP6252_10242 [Coleophoma cylindrospora]
MVELRDRIAAIQAALAEEQDVKFAEPPARHSLDHRFDPTAPEVDAAPAPTPARERTNPFESIHVPALNADSKPQFYDSIAQKFGLGILDDDEFAEYVVYDASLTNLRVCPLDMADHGHYYYVDYRFSLPNVPGVVLREGTEKTGKSLGAAHIPIQGENRLGVGDYDKSPHEMVWEKMGNTGFWTHMRGFGVG